jgi:hypothetical protein
MRVRAKQPHRAVAVPAAQHEMRMVGLPDLQDGGGAAGRAYRQYDGMGSMDFVAIGPQFPLVEMMVDVAHRSTIVCSPRGTSSPMAGAPGISPAIKSPPEVCASARSRASSPSTADMSMWGRTQSRLRRVPPLT